MGLATIDSHRHKVEAKLYKISKFGVNRPNSRQDPVAVFGHDSGRIGCLTFLY